MTIFRIFLIIFSLFHASQAVLARLPPKGWNSWDSYRFWVNETQVMSNAKFMSDELANYGFEYIVIDEGWWRDSSDLHMDAHNTQIDQYGRYIPVTDRFPSSAKDRSLTNICNAIKALGLKCGIHLPRGMPKKAYYDNSRVLGTAYTARDIANINDGPSGFNFGVNMSHPGGQIWYNSMVALYASWGIEFIKFDFTLQVENLPEIDGIHKAIVNSGSPIVLSLSYGGPQMIPEFIKRLSIDAQMYRLTGDTWDLWSSVLAHFEPIALNAFLSGPDVWPDADMLPLGRIGGKDFYSSVYPATCTVQLITCNFTTPLADRECCPRQSALTPTEQKSLLTLWMIGRSPLMYGGDFVESTDGSVALLQNKEILEVNGYSFNLKTFNTAGYNIWTADGTSKEKYVAVWNLGPRSASIAIDFADIELPSGRYLIRDLWARKDIGKFSGSYTTVYPVHGSGLYRFQLLNN
eukprot:TRINITY_DN5237_c0_g1_i1.p1 TRINITY_DN5237_c0_g1~~TRINITY_DN5237_c0_g1_i1.p1  ORF type:complete len:463 (-),score=126.33 TRINITY_DN5237_c0_g1_i1:61-1449(-)